MFLNILSNILSNILLCFDWEKFTFDHKNLHEPAIFSFVPKWLPFTELAHLHTEVLWSLEMRFMVSKLLNEMDKYSDKEKNISTDDILKALDRFGTGFKTPSPVEDLDRGKLDLVKLVSLNYKLYHLTDG